MSKKGIAYSLFALAAGLLIWWAAAGAHVFTMTEKLVPIKDPLFGTMVDHWEQSFSPGLEMIGPAILVLVIAGGWLMRKARVPTSSV